MTTEEFFDWRADEMSIDERLDYNRRALRALNEIAAEQGWTTFRFVIFEYAHESPDFIRLLLLHLQNAGCLFDDNLIDAGDVDQAKRPDNSKRWSQDVRDVDFIFH